MNIPVRDGNPQRTAVLEVKFSNFVMNASQNNARRKTQKLPNLNAIYVIEKYPPLSEEPMNWVLLTNINNFEEAVEKIQWYCLRWRIEVFHKILKSGLKVEECRLQAVDRLIRFLTVIAWRIFFITLVARTNPNLSCTFILTDDEWKGLYTKMLKTKNYPETPPPIRTCLKSFQE